jgi:hypothetical protein
MSNSKDTIRMVCKNPDCINKSIVYRRFDVMKDQTCKKCGHVLSADMRNSKRQGHRDQVAKKELEAAGQ